MNEECISKSVTRGTIKDEYYEILKVGDRSFHVAIRSDYYRHQCSAMIEYWNGASWVFVHSIHFQHMATPPLGDPRFEELCMKDRDELVRVAKQVVF